MQDHLKYSTILKAHSARRCALRNAAIQGPSVSKRGCAGFYFIAGIALLNKRGSNVSFCTSVIISGFVLGVFCFFNF